MDANKSQLDIETYVDRGAEVMGLGLRPEDRPGVIANFERIVAIADLVMEFPLSDDIEIAPIFEP